MITKIDIEKINKNFEKYLGLTNETNWDLTVDLSLIKTEHFSKYDIFCHKINTKNLINQLKLHKKYKTELNICILCSLYNSNPKLFYNNPKNIRKFINKKQLSRNVPSEIIEFFNTRYHKTILEYHENNILDYIKKSLRNNESPILCRNSFLNGSKHAVNIVGLDSSCIRYVENGNDSLINSIVDVYHKLFMKHFTILDKQFFKKYNCEYIEQFLERNFLNLILDNNKIFDGYKKLLHRFLGYDKQGSISKLFTKYLLASSRKLSVITFGDLQDIYVDIDEYGQNIVSKQIDINKDFSELITRLNNISIPSMGSFINNTLQIPDEYWDEVVQLKS